MKKASFITSILLTLAIGANVSASEIYKWTDADGNVHYGDKPVGEQSIRLAIRSNPTDPARIQAMAQARSEARAVATAEERAAAEQGPTEEERRAEARDRAQKCSTYRERLEKFVMSRRLYREDENGERVYLDDSEAQAARERVQNQVEEYCNS